LEGNHPFRAAPSPAHNSFQALLLLPRAAALVLSSELSSELKVALHAEGQGGDGHGGALEGQQLHAAQVVLQGQVVSLQVPAKLGGGSGRGGKEGGKGLVWEPTDAVG
jgi:hypothetical protein